MPIDTFLSESQRALRREIRKRLTEASSLSEPEGNPRPVDPNGLFQAIRKAVPDAFETREPAGKPRLLERYLTVEETSSFSPALGMAISGLIAGTGGAKDGEEAVLSTAERLGSAVFVLEACYQAARKREAFSSTLMGPKHIQQGLADLSSGLETSRLEVYRALFLLEDGRTDQGAEELVRSQVRLNELHREIFRLASGLLSDPWLRKRLPIAYPGAAGPAGPKSEDADERRRS